MSHPAPGITQSSVPAGVIDLGLGHPSNALLPLSVLAQSAAHRFAAGDPSFLQYGSEAGSLPFRTSLAAFLQQATNQSTRADSLFVTNGVSQALDLICTLFTQPGDLVMVEQPTYFLALRIFADHGLRVMSLPMDAEGLKIDRLEDMLRTGERPRLLYTIPTHQNPSGVTLAAERRAHLVALSREFGFHIVADEVYHLLTFEGSPPPPLASWSDEPTLLALGSFSKILAPGLRLGWLHAAPPVLERFALGGVLDSGGGLNPFTGAMVQDLLESGQLSENIARLNAIYRTRRDALADALGRHLPRAQFSIPSGGYFLWVDLGAYAGEGPVEQRALAAGVGLRAGERFVPESPPGHSLALRSMARLCFAYYKPEELEEGVRRLARALRDV